MSRSSSHPVPAPPGAAGDLLRLLETEQALARGLESARRECTAIVARARDAMVRAEQQLEAELERERGVRSRELEQETVARIAAVEAAARARAARFSSATDRDVETLAAAVLRWLGEPDGEAG
jgi:hypothetical protein